MSFKVEVQANGEWVQNHCRFKTREEANLFASDIFERWSAVMDTRVITDKLPANYRFITQLVNLDEIHEYVPDRFEVSGENRPNCYAHPRCAKDTKGSSSIKCNLPRDDEVHRT